jgi:acyl-CoA synthetase (AMP-forming)/AMP-acid ligase II
MLHGLIDWLDEPRAGHGFHFATDDGWSFWDYPRVASYVASAARQIEELRRQEHGAVVIVARSGVDFVAAFLGALVAGNTPSPLAFPAFARDRQRYVEHAAGILATAQPALILADAAVHDIVADAATLAGIPDGPERLELEHGESTPYRRRPAELALLQFTSGSSGNPRAVRVTWSNLEANIAQIRRWLRMTPEDHTPTWLPLYHDMGLIGCFLTPMVNQSDVWILRPEQFIADPIRWLECFGSRGAQLTASPNFGFAVAGKRVSDEALEGMDFSNWRAAIVGAERLDAAVLNAFAERLAPFGFRPQAFLPAYGLAEATLAVTGLSMSQVPRVVRPDWSTARFGEEIPVEEETDLLDTEAIGNGEGWVVGCGPPHPEIRVAITDEDGSDLPDASLGEISVEGPTVADGYLGAGGTSSFEGGRLRTGDAGFTLDGELFVLGRLGDSVKIRGRTVFVEDLEARLATVDGVRKGRCVVLAGSDGIAEYVVAVFEQPAGDWIDGVIGILATAAADAAKIEVFTGEPGAIERTSSGKPRRRVMWQQFLEGRLEAEPVHPVEPDTGTARKPARASARS